ncbi:MAG: hypothetical protein H6719_20340 [Sandaracinaceae bacterium]|nr:hypothetical protein [Sandaracinaceae bacterium]
MRERPPPHDPKQAHAFKAVYARIAQATVFILPGARTAAPTDVWSGTVVHSPGGRLVVLASKHMFERSDLGDRPFRVGWYDCPDTLDPFAPPRVEHPDDVDVACFLVPRDREGPMREHAISHAHVVPWIAEAEDDDTVLLSGYPTKMMALEIDHRARRGTVGMTNVSYALNVQDLGRDDRGRVTLEWRDMVVDPDPTIRELPPPNGMSGGALWYLDGRENVAGAIWQPRQFLRVVGVQSAWDPTTRIAKVEGSDRWIDWFREAIGLLDEAPW